MTNPSHTSLGPLFCYVRAVRSVECIQPPPAQSALTACFSIIVLGYLSHCPNTCDIETIRQCVEVLQLKLYCESLSSDLASWHLCVKPFEREPSL